MTERIDQAGHAGGEELAEPLAYQRRLVGLVGYDDPALVQAATGLAWRALVDEAGPDLRNRPAPGEWSVLECLGHAVDGELVMSGRYRWALAEDDPEIVGYDQDRWVAALEHGHADPADLLRLFETLRAANLALWRATTPAQRARSVRHRERGAEIARPDVHDDRGPRPVPSRPGSPGARVGPGWLTQPVGYDRPHGNALPCRRRARGAPRPARPRRGRARRGSRSSSTTSWTSTPCWHGSTRTPSRRRPRRSSSRTSSARTWRGRRSTQAEALANVPRRERRLRGGAGHPRRRLSDAVMGDPATDPPDGRRDGRAASGPARSRRASLSTPTSRSSSARTPRSTRGCRSTPRVPGPRPPTRTPAWPPPARTVPRRWWRCPRCAACPSRLKDLVSRARWPVHRRLADPRGLHLPRTTRTSPSGCERPAR